VFDARKEEAERQRQELEKPRPYSGILQEHHKQGSLVTEQNGQTGYLKERYRDDAVFKSLELNSLQEQKAKLYIEIHDAYHTLYNNENSYAVSESLAALREATSRPITFEEPDFNFGERWIPAGIYGKYASYLFDVETGIHLYRLWRLSG
jgi:hypothetical protein